MFMTRRGIGTRSKARHAGDLFAGFLAGLVVFELLVRLGMNSIFASSAVFLVAVGAIVWLRRDLLMYAVVSGFMMVGLAVLLYLLLFGVLIQGYWQRHWFLSGGAAGWLAFNSVPLTELVWYWSASMLISVAYPFVSGRGIERRADRISSGLHSVKGRN